MDADLLLAEVASMIFVDPKVDVAKVPEGVRGYIEHSQRLLGSVVEERDSWQRKYYAAIGEPCPLDALTASGVPEPSTETI
jgi:hypothetical protein